MNYDVIKTLMRRYLRNPAIYALSRRIMLLGQLAARRPDEPDFLAFKALARETGLVVDIGANGGQSAVAFSFLLPKFDIVSFEPNPALWKDLEFIKRMIGPRFSFRKTGLGPQASQMTLFVPQIGDLPITTRASLDRAAAENHCDRLEKEINQRPVIREVKVDIVSFDSLGLKPDIVKIDVEGCERAVLEGMMQTLTEARPILLVESNAHDRDCMDMLAPLGYHFYYFDTENRLLSPDPKNRTRNWFAVPPHREKQFLAPSSEAQRTAA